jgi:hypothetical protein
MANERQITVKILGDSSSAERAFQVVNKQSQSLGQKMTKFGGTLTKNLTLPILAGSAALLGFAKGAEDAEIANRKLDAVLTEMGFGDATKRVSNYAEELERTIAIDADVIKATQTKLATFKELTASVGEAGGAFDRATMAALNMAAAGFGEATSNAVQLGKALNDPIKGITALSRAGITFTETEKEKIKALVESGNLLAAQDMVLSAIEGQLGDTAAASASSFQRIKLSLMQVADSIGMAVLPLLDSFARFVSETLVPQVIPFIERITESFKNLDPGIKTAILAVTAFAAAIGPVLLIVGKLIGIFIAIKTGIVGMAAAFTALTGPVGITIAALAALTAGVIFLYKNNEDFRQLVQRIWPLISNAIGTSLTMVKKFIDDNRPALAALADAFMRFASMVSQILTPVLVFLIQNGLQVLINVLRGVILVMQFLIDVTTRVIEIFRQTSDATRRFTADLVSGFSQAMSIVRGFTSTVSGAFSNASNLLFNTGRDIVMGLWRGMQSLTSYISTEVSRWVNNVIPAPIRRILKISSPSRVFEDIGESLVDGLVLGLDDNATRAVDSVSAIANTIQAESSFQFEQAGFDMARSFAESFIDALSPGGFLFDGIMSVIDSLADALNRSISLSGINVGGGGSGGGGGGGGGGGAPMLGFTDVNRFGGGAAQNRVVAEASTPEGAAALAEVAAKFAEIDYSFLGVRPGMPLFAKGGIVKSATLGIVGEAGPEAIIPLNRANGLGSTYNITVNPGLSTNAETGRAVVEAIKRYERTSGQVFATA